MEPTKKLVELIDNIDIAMITTVDVRGALRSRPMVAQRVEFDGYLWFVTKSASETVKEIRKHPKLNVSYAAADGSRYVSVSGTARVVKNKKKLAELWRPAL
jgi:general stress protein 26